MRKVLTEEQKQYIKEHPKESAFAMAKKFCCSEQSVYYWLHVYHGDSFLKVKIEEKEHKHKVVREMYPTHSATDIAKLLGITRSAVNNMAKRLGVRHTEETQRKLAEKSIKATNRPEIQEKRIASLRETIRKEQLRVCYGLPQKTKRKFSFTSNRRLCARNYLVRKYNYFYDKEAGSLVTIFYDRETKRLSPDKEKYYSDKYGLLFRQAG